MPVKKLFLRSTKRDSRSGQLTVEVLFFAVLTVILLTGFIFAAAGFLKLSVRSFNRTQAFEIAEAGIEYYRWHLAHAPADYWDGQGATSTGPYVHSYFDKEGTAVGQFSLAITPPAAGGTSVTVMSTGKVLADTSVTKIIRVTFTIPTFAQYSLAVNSNIQIGTGTEVFGTLFANGGIHFDGFAHNLVESALTTYNDPSHGGQAEWAVHTHVPPLDPYPPTPFPWRPDVFLVGRTVGVPAANFVGVTANLASIKTAAQNGGVYASSSGAYGYDLAFSTTTSATTTYALYKVTDLTKPPNGCTNTSNQPGWGSWSVNTETLVATGTIPGNSTFFVEDNLWVRGQINHNRITVASGVFPSNSATWSTITVNQDLRYSNYDGTDAITLIAQNNINVGLYSNDTLRIDAALLAQNGRIGRFYYQPPNLQSHAQKCSPWGVRTQITVYGTLITNQPYEFGFDDGSGYQKRILIFDSNLLTNPPPGFPTTSNQYVPTSWTELQ